MMDTSKIRSVGIVGAGVAGLATARSLIGEGIGCTLFERSATLGGVWADGYLNFGVQVQKELYEFPDWPLPEDVTDFTPGPVIHDYLSNFAAHFGISPHIRFNSPVTSIVECEGEDSGWVVEYENGDEQKLERFDLVVICIGLYSNQPHVADFPGREHFSGDVMHNSLLKSPQQLANKRVAVVGFGKSATDAALESAAVAAETHIIFRSAHWPIPQKLAGILPFKWGLLHRLNSTLIPLYQNPTPVEKIVHGLGKPLVWLYWRLVEALLYVQCQLGGRFGKRVSLVPDVPIEIDAFGESTMVPRSEFYRRARLGDIDLHKTTVASYTSTGLSLEDGSQLELDVVVLATGWKTDFSFISPDVWQRLQPEDDGFYLYRHLMNPDTPGLFFVGRAASISSILTYCLQAHWLAQLIIGNVSLPPVEDIKKNIDEMKSWKRAWIPFSSSRSARLIAHTQHYHDELLGDFHVSPLRKTGVLAPLKELIVPYEPRDYTSLFTSSKT